MNIEKTLEVSVDTPEMITAQYAVVWEDTPKYPIFFDNHQHLVRWFRGFTLPEG